MCRIRMIGILGATILAVTACGSGSGKSASQVRPPTAVNLTVYVNDSKVSVSPSSVGAGPVVFIVTNQASHSEALAISKSGENHALASTAPINPQGTTQVSVDFKPGDYTISTGNRGKTDAQQARPASIASASIHIGRPRAPSNNELLQP
jgi:hypothetical protein